MKKGVVILFLTFLMMVQSVSAISNVQHSVDGDKVTLTYQGNPPFWINIRGDTSIGQSGGYLWAKTNSNTFTYDMGFAINPSKKFYYGVKDNNWGEIYYFEIGLPEDNVLKEACNGYLKEFDDIRGNLKHLPTFKDISQCDLSNVDSNFMNTLIFNEETVWPNSNKLPINFNPTELANKGMNPGMGIKDLHEQGITGQGVNVAIIDQPMFRDHPEYNGKIIEYYDIGCENCDTSMHGPAVASLLVGKNIGVAPGAGLYFAGVPSWLANSAYYANALNWIIETNEALPTSEKIKVVSVSANPSGHPFTKNTNMWTESVALAKREGIHVIDVSGGKEGDICAGWYDLNNPNNLKTFSLGFPDGNPWSDPKCIHVPNSQRTTAREYDERSNFGYNYWGQGGLSWGIPYASGVLALGWQVNPDLSYEEIMNLLFASAHITNNGAKVINPKEFINLVKATI
ncbi:hypothetical protein CL617_05250 [archaeon]|nr:hypothetical protein [archaeon]|tara:strand:- start:780 stop:2147 length:1368 start_codon:yes stop_codon:yes gene_type:complete